MIAKYRIQKLTERKRRKKKHIDYPSYHNSKKRYLNTYSSMLEAATSTKILSADGIEVHAVFLVY